MPLDRSKSGWDISHSPKDTGPVEVRACVNEDFTDFKDRLCHLKSGHYSTLYLGNRADRKSQVRQCLDFFQLIHRLTRGKMSCTKTHTLPNLRLPIRSVTVSKITTVQVVLH